MDNRTPFINWLYEQLGTDQWFVGRRMPVRRRGWLAISPKRFAALEAEWLSQGAALEAEYGSSEDSKQRLLLKMLNEGRLSYTVQFLDDGQIQVFARDRNEAQEMARLEGFDGKITSIRRSKPDDFGMRLAR